MSESVQIYWLNTNKSDERGFIDLLHSGLEQGWNPRVPSDDAGNTAGQCEYSVNRSQPTQSRSIPAMKNDIEKAEYAAVQLQHDRFRFVLRKNPRPSDFGSMEHIGIVANQAQFHQWEAEEVQQQTAKSNVRSLLAIAKLVAEAVQPQYGFGLYGELAENMIPSNEDFENGTIPYIHWFNCFGTEYIKAIGRDCLISAPAWKCEFVNTNHALVVATDNPVHPSEQYRNNLRKLASYFDVEL